METTANKILKGLDLMQLDRPEISLPTLTYLKKYCEDKPTSECITLLREPSNVAKEHNNFTLQLFLILMSKDTTPERKTKELVNDTKEETKNGFLGWLGL